MKEAENDAKIQEVLKRVVDGKEVNKEYSVVNERLLYKGKLVLSRTLSYIPLILKEFHAGLVGGHSGVLKTVKRVQNVFLLETDGE